MGFHISGETEFSGFITDMKQNLNLSIPAWLVIDEDIMSFGNGNKYNLAGFINRVFSNFYQESEAAIEQRYLEKSRELKKMFSSKEFKGMDKAATELYPSKILETYKAELIKKARSYEKGEGRKFRINNENVSILRESIENKCHDNSIANYMKAIFEEYARKPMFEREQIYFKDIMEVLQRAIAQKRRVKIKILQKINPKTNAVYARVFHLMPYKIVHDKTGMFNYVIGYSEELKENGGTWPRRAACYRISRLSEARILADGHITKDECKTLDKMLAEKEPQFLAGEIIEIKARFTDKGIESFNRQLYMRPRDFKKVEEEKNTYIFRCTEVQAINYFFKIARDVEIISPARTREKFIQRYKDAYESYVKPQNGSDGNK